MKLVKSIRGLILALGAISFSSFSYESRSVCSEIVTTDSGNAEVIANVSSGLGGEYIVDDATSIQVTYNRKVCVMSSTKNNALSTNGLPLPDTAQEGDTRTVEQTRGNIKTTYNQKYTNGAWITISYTRVDIGNPEDKPDDSH